MKRLFVNDPNNSDIQKGLYKPNNSKEIRLRRYAKHFFTTNVFELYSWLSFIALEFDFDVKPLLEIFLGNLYDDDKINEYVYQINKMENEGEIWDFHFLLLAPVLKQYMGIINFTQDKRDFVLKKLHLMIQINTSMMLFSNSKWNLKFLCIKNMKVKFCRKKIIEVKVSCILKKMCHEGSVPSSFIDFYNYIKNTLFLYDTDTNREIEEMLSRYYLLYCKASLSFP